MIRYSKPFLLSDKGSDHGSAYFLANKSVTLLGPPGDGRKPKTHVFWTDAVAKTCGRTFDHATRHWGETRTLGVGCDDHNNPCVTADAKGHLHLAFGPHGIWDHGGRVCDWPSGAFKYSVSAEPDSLAGLEKLKEPFGYQATYACLLHMSNGLDAIVYRGGEHPPAFMFQRQTEFGGWTQAKPLMIQKIKPEYTAFGAMLSCGKDGTLYAAGSFYCISRGSLGTAALMSRDFGDTWRTLSGKPVQTPIEYESRYAVPHPPADSHPRLDGLVVDSLGVPWFLTLAQARNSRQVLLSRWEEGRWHTVDVAAFLPPERNAFVGGLSLDTRDRLHVVVSAALEKELQPKQNAWSRHTSEVFHLWSGDRGKSFECNQISVTDPQFPSWLPTISRPGPFHPVEKPVILYTHDVSYGLPGEACKSPPFAEVYCVMIEEIG